MSYFYVNATDPGTVHESDERNARLDQLDNWTRYDTREAAENGGDDHRGYAIEQGVLTRAGMRAAPTITPRRDDDVPAPASTARKATARAAADDAGDDAASGSRSRHGR